MGVYPTMVAWVEVYSPPRFAREAVRLGFTLKASSWTPTLAYSPGLPFMSRRRGMGSTYLTAIRFRAAIMHSASE